MSLCGCEDHLLKVQNNSLLFDNTEPFITVISCYEIENEPPLVLTINSDAPEDDPDDSSDSENSSDSSFIGIQIGYISDEELAELESVLSQDSDDLERVAPEDDPDDSSDSENSSDSSFIGIQIGYISDEELAELESVLSQDSDDLERVEVVYLDVPDSSLEWDEVLYYEYDPAEEFSDIESMNDHINILDISLDKLQEFSDIVSMDHEINIMDTTLHTVDVPDPNLRGDELLYYEYDLAEEFSDIVTMNDENNNILDISLDKLQDCHRIRCLRDVSGPQ